MKLRTIKTLLDATVVCGQDQLEQDVTTVCSGDFMGDVMSLCRPDSVLLTGLVSPQLISTCVMKGVRCVVFVRGREPSPEVIQMGKDKGIVLLKTKCMMYKSCGLLYKSGLLGDD